MPTWLPIPIVEGLAFERNVTGTGTRGRGQGLAEVREYIRRLGGWVVLRSGRARFQLGPEYDKVSDVVAFPGTFVGAWLPTRRGGNNEG